MRKSPFTRRAAGGAAAAVGVAGAAALTITLVVNPGSGDSEPAGGDSSPVAASEQTAPAESSGSPESDGGADGGDAENQSVPQSNEAQPQQANSDTVSQAAEARDTEKEAKEAAGDAYAGTVMDADSGNVTVNVADKEAADKVEQMGYTVNVVDHSLQQLDAAYTGLNTAQGSANEKIGGWYVNPVDNSVVISAVGDNKDAAKDFAEKAGIDPETVTIDTGNEQPVLYGGDVIGGNPYFINGNTVCSIGFAVKGGFVTAGHCGDVGDPVAAKSGEPMGAFMQSHLGAEGDQGFVKTTDAWTPKPLVNDYQGGTVAVAGSAEAPVGASVCRSGRTTDFHCGTIQSKNQTVNYASGPVAGLTRTNVCAEPGDSGGSWVSNGHAQGVTSGGSGNCETGATTFFSPVNPILEKWDLELLTQK